MASSFRPGDPVTWWKWVSGSVEIPCRAEVLAVGAKRVTIAVEDSEGRLERRIRHVAPERLQPLGVYYERAICQGRAILEPATWGPFTRYLEIGEDLRPVRQVDVFENGNMLSYDRIHWVDGFGMLGGAEMNRNCKLGLWGHSEEIKSAEFERVWTSARNLPIWNQQVMTSQMATMGAVPMWLRARAPGSTVM